MIANYHTHTARCGHATGTEEEYIKAAIGSGIKILGFSDHVPYPFDDGFVSTVRMRVDQTEDYVNTLVSLREKYKDKIKIYIGYETEYFRNLFSACLDNLLKYELDYLILGQHYRESESLYPYNGSPTEDIDDVKIYVSECIEALETGKFLYIAHPDLINYVGSKTSEYKTCMNELCVAAKSLDIPLEWNILGMKGNRNYPSDTFFELAAKNDNKIILGVDAHSADALSDTASFEEAKRRVNAFGLSITDSLDL
ncbi:MAG: histidinol-phosphatase [Lachnospiraceae bacterium]|nr:histidinol-phosphatase [Lachnospiraceae bacterium]